MPQSRSLALLGGLCLGLTALTGPARADAILFQTATLDPSALAADNTLVLQGDGTSAGSNAIGADFTVTQAVTVTSIGAAFAETALTAGTGPIFGAIVSVDPVTGLPTQPLELLPSITLADTLFTPTTDGDTSAALSVTLSPGSYGVVFGSGLFGAAGVADLLVGNDTVGAPSIFNNGFAPFAQDPFDTDVRLFVAAAVPEPGSFVMLLTGGLVLAAMRRRI